MGKSTKPARSGKSSKRHPDFPLFKHASGRWAKKVRGKFAYFGKVETDPKGEAALILWLEQRDDLLAGRKPRKKGDGPTVANAVNGFLIEKELARDTGEITPRTFHDLETAGKRLAKVLGRDRPLSDLRPDDFHALKVAITKERRTLTTLAIEITRSRAPFAWAYKNGLIESPIRFGSGFDRPDKGKIRAERNRRRVGKTFEALEVRQLIDAAGVQLKAMVLLAVNCGFGPYDCAKLSREAIDLEAGWIAFPRPKTGVNRRCPLWPETIAALRLALEKRPRPTDSQDDGLAFITKYGRSWGDGLKRFPVITEFAKLAKELKLDRPGRGLYGLRHTFRTIAGGARDVEAARLIMGHVNEHVEETYVHAVDDDRLKNVVDHVHAWLFPVKEGGAA